MTLLKGTTKEDTKRRTAKSSLVSRPWGGYRILKKNHHLWVKRLYVKGDQRMSLQSHQQRDEVWIVLSGQIDAEVGGHHYSAGPDDVIFVPKNRKHRIRAITDACVLEVAYGTVLERDIVRYDDDYGRH